MNFLIKKIIVAVAMMCCAIGAGAQVVTPCSNNTFIKTLPNFSNATTEPRVFMHPNGNTFATGLRNDSIVMVYLDPLGSPIWERTFKFGYDAEQIRSMFIDTDGDIAGVSASLGSKNSTVFKCNMSGVFSLISKMPSFIASDIHNLSTTEYLITGTTYDVGVDYSYMTSVNKTSGALGATNGLKRGQGNFYSAYGNGILYGTSRRYYTSNGDFRSAQFAHNPTTGVQLWQNSIISETDATMGTQTRMYPTAPIIDQVNTALVVAHSGDLNGFGAAPYGDATDLVVTNSDLSGNLIWTKSYTLGTFGVITATQVLNTASGYYVTGNLYAGAIGEVTHSFIMKIDKNGNVQWTKRYGITGTNIIKNIVERNGFIYAVARTDSYGGTKLALLKLDTNGDVPDANCNFINTVPTLDNIMPNLQNALVLPNISNASSPSILQTISTSKIPVLTTHCSTPCVNDFTPIADCNNSVNITNINTYCPSSTPLAPVFSWGDGTSGTSTTHTYATSGTYSVCMEVGCTDANGDPANLFPLG